MHEWGHSHHLMNEGCMWGTTCPPPPSSSRALGLNKGTGATAPLQSSCLHPCMAALRLSASVSPLVQGWHWVGQHIPPLGWQPELCPLQGGHCKGWVTCQGCWGWLWLPTAPAVLRAAPAIQHSTAPQQGTVAQHCSMAQRCTVPQFPQVSSSFSLSQVTVGNKGAARAQPALPN